VPPEPASPAGVVDPFGLAPACLRLSPADFHTGRVALAVLSALLQEGERVDLVVQGRYQHYAAVAALTDRRVVLVNDHEWVPDVRSIPLTEDLVVQGWEEGGEASLVFVTEGRGVTIDLIRDHPLAHELAKAVRERVAAVG
jgi:hypothetical protein